MSYYFFLGRDLLPIAPGKVDMTINNKNSTFNLINDGEINVLRAAGLTEVTFDALLPNQRYPFATYLLGFQAADYYLSRLKQLKARKQPFQFIVCRMLPSHKMLFCSNLKVSLESYAIHEAKDNGFDVMATIRLKQYRPYATKVIEVSKDESGAVTATEKTARDSSKEPAASHAIGEGETLWEATKKELGKVENLDAVAANNGLTNPNAIPTGQVIRFG